MSLHRRSHAHPNRLVSRAVALALCLPLITASLGATVSASADGTPTVPESRPTTSVVDGTTSTADGTADEEPGSGGEAATGSSAEDAPAAPEAAEEEAANPEAANPEVSAAPQERRTRGGAADDGEAPPSAPLAAGEASVRVTIAQQTGTEPFQDNDDPGNDSGPDNDVVRTNDTITYTVGIRFEGEDQTNPTVRFTIPQGQELVSLPPFCRAGSGVTPPTLPSAPVPRP